MKNWKTTVAGILSATGLCLINSDDATTKMIGTILAAIGTAMMGAVAKDHNVTGGSIEQ